MFNPNLPSKWSLNELKMLCENTYILVHISIRTWHKWGSVCNFLKSLAILRPRGSSMPCPLRLKLSSARLPPANSTSSSKASLLTKLFPTLCSPCSDCSSIMTLICCIIIINQMSATKHVFSWWCPQYLPHLEAWFQGRSRGGGEKCLSSGYILKTEPMGFGAINWMYIVYKRKRGAKAGDKVFALSDWKRRVSVNTHGEGCGRSKAGIQF